jgi:hypothetical protein
MKKIFQVFEYFNMCSILQNEKCQNERERESQCCNGSDSGSNSYKKNG